MVGDGHIGKYKNKPNGKPFVHYELYISGNLRDKEYYEHYVNELIFRIFNIRFYTRIVKKQNSITLRKDSKAIYEFLSKVLRIPSRKDNIDAPYQILEGNSVIKTAFLRGLADADFCLTLKHKPNAYPVIHGTSKSKKLISQCSEILNDLGIQNNTLTEPVYDQKRDATYIHQRVYVNGRKRVSKFMNLIQFSNKLKHEKYAKYQEILEKRA